MPTKVEQFCKRMERRVPAGYLGSPLVDRKGFAALLRVVRAAGGLAGVRYDDLESRADAFDTLDAALDDLPETGDDDE